MNGERLLILFLVLFMFTGVAQCYRDEGITKIGRQNMCVKLSASMEEYESCVNPKPKEIPK